MLLQWINVTKFVFSSQGSIDLVTEQKNNFQTYSLFSAQYKRLADLKQVHTEVKQ